MSQPTLGRLIGDAWALFRRDHDLIVRIAAPFVFVPTWTAQLLADPPPGLPATRDDAAINAWIDAAGQWAGGNALYYLAADALAVFGLAVIALLLLDRDRPDVATALRHGVARYARFLILAILISIPVSLGMWLVILPGLYAQARLVLAVPAMAARGVAARDAFGRSLRATRRVQLALFAAVTALFLAQWLLAMPFLAIDGILRQPGRLNPFVLALADAGIAASQTGYRVALLLLGVALYRRMASSGT